VRHHCQPVDTAVEVERNVADVQEALGYPWEREGRCPAELNSAAAAGGGMGAFKRNDPVVVLAQEAPFSTPLYSLDVLREARVLEMLHLLSRLNLDFSSIKYVRNADRVKDVSVPAASGRQGQQGASSTSALLIAPNRFLKHGFVEWSIVVDVFVCRCKVAHEGLRDQENEFVREVGEVSLAHGVVSSGQL
jgi:hypothetical protein